MVLGTYNKKLIQYSREEGEYIHNTSKHVYIKAKDISKNENIKE